MRRVGRRVVADLLVLCVVGLGAPGCDTQAQTPAEEAAPVLTGGLWISPEEVRSLPMQGPAWEALVEEAYKPAAWPNLSNQNDSTNVRVLAKALYFARTGDEKFARQVEKALEKVQGSEAGANSLAVSRELMAYIIAAELIGLEGAPRDRFETWLRGLQTRSFEGRTIRSTHEDRPNNWGTHAGATRLAMAIYLGDRPEIERSAEVFRGWTGEAGGWQGFKFGELWWQAEGAGPFAVNPRGAIHQGHPIGGVLPDDQRRGGPFEWPPPKENYVYEALQGAVAQAVLLDRLGYDSWEWGDRALLRAFEWLDVRAEFPAVGDDTWLPHIVNRIYGSRFPASTPTQPGKAMGFSDWTSPVRTPQGARSETPPPALVPTPTPN